MMTGNTHEAAETEQVAMKLNPDETVVIPLGHGILVRGEVLEFEKGIVGPLFRVIREELLPDPLPTPGTLMPTELVQAISMDTGAPTFFLPAATPDALYELAEALRDLADQWTGSRHLQELDTHAADAELDAYLAEFKDDGNSDAALDIFEGEARTRIGEGKCIAHIRELGWDHFADWIMKQRRSASRSDAMEQMAPEVAVEVEVEG